MFRSLVLFVAALCLPTTAVVAQLGPQVAPGVTLPDDGSIVAVISSPVPSEMVLKAGEIHYNPHSGGNFARSMVYAGPQAGIELEGVSSATTLPANPTFYVRLAADTADLQRSRLTLVRCEPGKDVRVVAHFSANVFGGHHKRYADEVPLTKLDGPTAQWLKVMPEKPLEPGEYAFIFLPKDPTMFGDVAYSFRVAAKP